SPARRRTSSSRPGSAWPPPRRTSPGSPRRWIRCPVGVSPPDRCPGTAASTTGPQRTDGGGGTVVGGRVTSVEFAQIEAELLERGFIRMVFDLGRIEELLDTLGNPQHAYPSIHITGTNGKTSTARMIDSLLRAHGLRTGRYTSPHLESVRERISIDGEPVDEERFVAAYREVGPVADLLDARRDEPLTCFYVTPAMAFVAFADAPVDVAVVDVGLGGAEDSTNVLRAGVCVLTPIGLDHTEWLGDTVADIAHAKAGII